MASKGPAGPHLGNQSSCYLRERKHHMGCGVGKVCLGLGWEGGFHEDENGGRICRTTQARESVLFQIYPLEMHDWSSSNLEAGRLFNVQDTLV